MNSSARIPAWVDRYESNHAICVRHLVTSKKFFADGVEATIHYIGIAAAGIAMPDVDMSAGYRMAASFLYAGYADFKGKRQPFAYRAVGGVEPDIGTPELFIDEIGTFHLLRGKDA